VKVTVLRRPTSPDGETPAPPAGMRVGTDLDFTVGDDTHLEHPGVPDDVVHCLDDT
jgi:hypothetical protein